MPNQEFECCINYTNHVTIILDKFRINPIGRFCANDLTQPNEQRFIEYDFKKMIELRYDYFW